MTTITETNDRGQMGNTTGGQEAKLEKQSTSTSFVAFTPFLAFLTPQKHPWVTLVLFTTNT
jgi:hypothetical protein